MPFAVPTLKDLVRIAENGLSSEFYGEETVLRKSVLKVIARVFAGIAYLLVLFLQKMWKNCFITSCDDETLEDFGVDYDFPNKPEGYSRGQVLIKKTAASSVTLSQGTVLVYDGDKEFEVDANYTLSGAANSVFPVKVIAFQPGSESNVGASAVLQFRDGTPEGLDGEPIVDAEGLSGGVRKEVVINGNTEYWGETAESYRERLLDYRRNPPSGGSVSDYRIWAERFPFVTKCIVQPLYPVVGAVTCVLAYFDDEAQTIAVNSTNVAEVDNYIHAKDRRPATADVRVVSCLPKSVNFSIRVAPFNSSTKSSVVDALKLVLQSYEPGDVIVANDLTEKMRGASSAERVNVFGVGSSDSVSLSKADHELPVIGTISWVNADA